MCAHWNCCNGQHCAQYLRGSKSLWFGICLQNLIWVTTFIIDLRYGIFCGKLLCDIIKYKSHDDPQLQMEASLIVRSIYRNKENSFCRYTVIGFVYTTTSKRCNVAKNTFFSGPFYCTEWILLLKVCPNFYLDFLIKIGGSRFSFVMRRDFLVVWKVQYLHTHSLLESW
jgi:hypothetical protein